MVGKKRRAGGRRKIRTEITKEDVFKYIQRTEQRSANIRSILDNFDATAAARRQIKDILGSLVREGKVDRHKGDRYEAPKQQSILGTIILHRDGYGFVVPTPKIPGLDSDIFIPSVLTGSAMNGDKVQVEITLRKPGGRAEGRVINVEKRARETIVGQVRWDGEVFFVAPTDEKLPGKILITDDASEHKDKIVEVELTRFPSASHWPAGRIVSVIGFLDDPNVETTVIVKKFGLPASFPKEVEGEAAALPDEIEAKQFIGRDDFRTRNTLTIDPVTARDFDDAIDVEILPDGSFQVGIHIADVSNFVAVDSAMDTEARCRGTSVYFPDRVIPMLPEKVSNELCSLNPRVDRLALSVMLHLSKSGEVMDHSFHKSVIRSKQRLTYEDVQKILDGNASIERKYADVSADIRNLARLAEILSRRRRERGSIDFDLPEPMLTYDEQGMVQGIVKSVRLFSHRMVEECMILANEVVARHMEEMEIPALYRVHEKPDPGKVSDFADLVGGFGLKFRAYRNEPAEFQKFIASIAGRPEERMLSYLMLRSFKQAVYSPDNSGHFGLASDAYTHFTSPIRRYPDLVVHRILKASIARQPQLLKRAQLEAIAVESSERERSADQAERELLDWKKMILMERLLGETLDGIVIAVWKDGFSVELIEYFIEGFVSLADIRDDHYKIDTTIRALIGQRSGRRFRIGDRLAVNIARVDKLLRRAYFVPVLARTRGSR